MTDYAIEFSDFCFEYPSDNAECRAYRIGPINWHVRAGEFQLLVGATGCGKTTLLRNLKPAIRPHGKREGSLAVFGAHLDANAGNRGAAEAVKADELRANTTVGFVFQSPENQLVCDSVWHEITFGLENLGVSQDEMRRRVAEMVHFFGIESWFDRSIDELSGGQKQIVALAGVLVMQPRILVLDEPTEQLDPIAEKNFMHALFRVNRELDITVVLSTHAPESSVEYATSAVRLDQGRLQEVDLADFAAGPLDVSLLRRDVVGFSHSEDALRVVDAYVRYDRDSDWVLRGCDFALRRQEIRALIGGNGCGKSTLLRAAAGVLPCKRGRVDNRLAKSQAYLPQNPKELFVCDSVLEELTEWQRFAGYSDDDVRDLAAKLSLDGLMQQHPYDLSGGQQQLLALAKILLTNPQIIFLDEPTKGLDAATKLIVADALLAARDAGASIVFATHDLTFAALMADSATMLFDGQDASTQPIANFFENSMFYRPPNDSFAKAWIEGRG